MSPALCAWVEVIAAIALEALEAGEFDPPAVDSELPAESAAA